MPDLPRNRKVHEPVPGLDGLAAPSGPTPGRLESTHKVHDPLAIQVQSSPPLTQRPSRRAFLELCEGVRFRLDGPTPIEQPARIEGRRALREVRSELLGKSLRIDDATTPELASLLRLCCDRLHRPVTPEVFVTGEDADNAGSYSVAPDDLHFLEFGGQLFEVLTDSEVMHVMGHEMGHQALHAWHQRRSKSELGRIESLLASQAREISADRVGLMACGDVESAATALVWIGTKLPRRFVRLRLETLTAQMAEIPANANGWQLFMTHPFLHFRLWALMKFAETDLFRAHAGHSGGKPFQEVEREIVLRFESLGGGEFRLQRSRQIGEATVWLATMFLQDIPEHQERAMQAVQGLIGSIQAGQAIDILKQCGAEEVRARAMTATREAIEADPGSFDTLRATLDQLCVSVQLDLRRTEAWLVLAEAKDAASSP
jgi:hypothetical protein